MDSSEALHKRVEELEAKLLAALERIAEREAKLQAALARIAELEEKLNQKSQNSSKPPSSYPPGMMRRSVESSGRSPGGQPAHRGKRRELLPLEQVNRVVSVSPERCHQCQGKVHQRRDGPEPLRHQQIEFPPIEPEVTEYQLHSAYCKACGIWTCASLPPNVSPSAFGARLTAAISLLTGRYRLSKRMVRDILWDLMGVEIAVGSVSNLEQRMSAALEVPVEEVREFIRHEAIVHQDETGWREALRLAWLWVSLTKQVTVFDIVKKRNATVSQAILGLNFQGILVSDRHHAYGWKDPRLRQICWSHLRRDFQRMTEGGEEVRPVGKILLRQSKIVFRWWRWLQIGRVERTSFVRRMTQVKREVGRCLRFLKRRRRLACWSTSAKRILKIEKSLWTFVHVEGVEPTNNPAERAVRHAVLWRKSSLGTFSEKGSKFAERILTTIATLRQQCRNVLEFLTAAYSAHLLKRLPPSLLPAKS